MHETRRKTTIAFAALAVISLGACGSPSETDTLGAQRPGTVRQSPAPTQFEAGNYEATGLYQSPGGVQEVLVRMELDEEGTVVEVEVEPQARVGNAAQFQQQFARGIRAKVVGVPITDLDVTRVSGSSLTSGGFNAAVEKIIEEAAR